MARPALSASRAAAIIALLTGCPRKFMTMAEIVRATGINVGSCFAVLTSMVESGLLYRDEARKSYGLGPLVLAAGLAVAEAHPAAAAAQGLAHDLARTLDVAVLLSTKLGNDQLVLNTVASRTGLRFDVALGQRLALTPPLGAELVASATETEIEAWIAQAHPSAAVAEDWREKLALIRARGFHISLRDPCKAGARDMLAEMVDAGSEIGTSDWTIELVNGFGWDFLVLERFEMNQLYNVSTIAAPIFIDRDQPPLSLALGAFGRALAGREIDHYVKRLVDTCRTIDQPLRGL